MKGCSRKSSDVCVDGGADVDGGPSMKGCSRKSSDPGERPENPLQNEALNERLLPKEQRRQKHCFRIQATTS